jgi:hypothetical protein
MAETPRKKKKKLARRERKERRFLPEPTQGSKLVAIVGMLGAAAAGAGVYGLWVREDPVSYARFLVAAGAVVLGIALWMADFGIVPVRVGDGGVVVEKGKDLLRLAWCDMDRIFVEGDQLVMASEALTLRIPIKGQPKAVAWILSEATQRVPDAMDVKRSVVDDLPEPKEDDGQLMTIDSLQVAGRHCKQCSKLISFERDARLCPTCAEVYHHDHLPKKCTTCNGEIAGRAVRA